MMSVRLLGHAILALSLHWCSAAAWGQVCPGTGDCLTAHGGQGCDDEGCCLLVCVADPFCCE